MLAAVVCVVGVRARRPSLAPLPPVPSTSPPRSFYANPLLDAPAGEDAALAARFPALARPNLWPSELPELEAAFKVGPLLVGTDNCCCRSVCEGAQIAGAACNRTHARTSPGVTVLDRLRWFSARAPQDLGQLIIRVGLLLMAHCDKYVAARAGFPPRLHAILQSSPCPKGAWARRAPCQVPPAQRGPPSWAELPFPGLHHDRRPPRLLPPPLQAACCTTSPQQGPPPLPPPPTAAARPPTGAAGTLTTAR